MTAIEEIEAAVKRLQNVKSILGYVAAGEDPTELYACVEDDDDDDGERFTTGLSIGGGDSDEEINEAIVTLSNTIDAQLAILAAGLLYWKSGLVYGPGERGATQLARAINGTA